MLRLYEISVDRNALVRNMDLNIERQIIEKDNDNINKNKNRVEISHFRVLYYNK